MKGRYTTTIMGNCPSKSNCYRVIRIAGHSSLGKTQALKNYEESFMWQCGYLRDLGISGPFELYVDVFYPSKRSDLDNALKVIEDCMQRANVIKNDNNCMMIVARKFIDKERPRVELGVTPIE